MTTPKTPKPQRKISERYDVLYAPIGTRERVKKLCADLTTKLGVRVDGPDAIAWLLTRWEERRG